MTSVDSNFNFLCGRPHGAGPPPPVHLSLTPLPPPCGRHKWMAPRVTCQIGLPIAGFEVFIVVLRLEFLAEVNTDEHGEATSIEKVAGYVDDDEDDEEDGDRDANASCWTNGRLHQRRLRITTCEHLQQLNQH